MNKAWFEIRRGVPSGWSRLRQEMEKDETDHRRLVYQLVDQVKARRVDFDPLSDVVKTLDAIDVIERKYGG